MLDQGRTGTGRNDAEQAPSRPPNLEVLDGAKLREQAAEQSVEQLRAEVPDYNFEQDASLDEATRETLRTVQAEADAYVESLTFGGVFTEDDVLHQGDQRDVFLPLKMEGARQAHEAMRAQVREAAEQQRQETPEDPWVQHDALWNDAVDRMGELLEDHAERTAEGRTQDTVVTPNPALEGRTQDTVVIPNPADPEGTRVERPAANTDVEREDIEELQWSDIEEDVDGLIELTEQDILDSPEVIADIRAQALSDSELEAQYEVIVFDKHPSTFTEFDSAVKRVRAERFLDGAFQPDKAEVLALLESGQAAEVNASMAGEEVTVVMSVREETPEDQQRVESAEAEVSLESAVYDFLDRVSQDYRAVTMEDFMALSQRFDEAPDREPSPGLAELGDDATEEQVAAALLRDVQEYVNPAFLQAVVESETYTIDGKVHQFDRLVDKKMRQFGEALAAARDVLLEDLSDDVVAEEEPADRPLGRGEWAAYAMDAVQQGAVQTAGRVKGFFADRWTQRRETKAWKFLAPKLEWAAKARAEASVWLATTGQEMVKAYRLATTGSEAPKVLEASPDVDAAAEDTATESPEERARKQAEIRAATAAEKRAAFRARAEQRAQKRRERQAQKQNLAAQLAAVRSFRSDLGL